MSKVIKTMSVNKELWEAFKEKCGLAPMSAVIGKLLEKFVKGEIKL